MPRTLTAKRNDGWDSSGINITWTPSKQRLDIYGWFDSIVGIEGRSMTLAEFFSELGITQKDCEKAFRSKRASR